MASEMQVQTNSDDDQESTPEAKPTRAHQLIYDVEEWPPIPISISVAFQHLLGCLGGIVTLTYTVSDAVCLTNIDPIRSQIFCSSLFMIGLSTVVQSLIGVRLPVFQGPSFTFLPPIIAMKTSGEWLCPEPIQGNNMTVNSTTNTSSYNELVYSRMNQLQGSLMLASIIEVVLGGTGAVGICLRFVGPITSSVTIFLLGYSLYPVPISYSKSYWPVALTSAFIVIVCGIYLAHVRISLPRCCRRRGVPSKGYSICDVFAILISIIITWILCFVLTRAGVLPDDQTEPAYKARTDTRTVLIETTPWFFFPYPGQFGAPGFNMALFIGFLSVVISSAMESVGDYFTIGKTCDAFPVPSHAVNRGILIEGLMSVLSASLGTGHATTSYTTNAAVVAITKVGSRYVLALAGVMGMVLAIFGKLGAVMTSMPDPIIGGITLVSLGIVLSLGIAGLRVVDMTSSRNISVVGMSIFIPIISSEWLNRNPGQIQTGSYELDKVIEIIIGFPMILGIIIAVFLDNTIKGTKKERGFELVTADVTTVVNGNDTGTTSKSSLTMVNKGRDIFDLPYINHLCRNNSCLKYLPFIQTNLHTKIDFVA
ncbi:solute carrier family 23 member 2-like [Pecten maximus]|uniref:solute carrier family 23 member 2-like n=1 Tax=Pecten maximus TaxID=6579 RepID=UPI001458961B|nr:solute carrier family 23 member 2-like [Pecten maximus]